MSMPPPLRKLVLTVHVVCSVGWLGAVVVFLALAGIALTSQDVQVVRGVYLVMEPAAWLALVPFACASLLSGVIQSLGTAWGLFCHYWVLFKLLMTAFSTAILLLYMTTFRLMASVVRSSDELGVLRNPSPVLHAGAALLILIVATALSVYKPRGLTRYGWRKQHEQRQTARS